MDDYRALIFLGIVALVVNHYWHKRAAMGEKVKRISKALKTFSLESESWNERHLKKEARTTFKAYAAAMDTLHAFDLKARGPNFYEDEISHLLHPKATSEVKSGNTTIYAYQSVLAQTKSQFDVSIIHARNSSNNDKDCFTACIDSMYLELIHDEEHWEMFTNMRIIDDGPTLKKKA